MLAHMYPSGWYMGKPCGCGPNCVEGCTLPSFRVSSMETSFQAPRIARPWERRVGRSGAEQLAESFTSFERGQAAGAEARFLLGLLRHPFDSAS